MPATPNAATIPLLNLHGDFGELHETIDAGFLLPTRFYSDPAIFQGELSTSPCAKLAHASMLVRYSITI